MLRRYLDFYNGKLPEHIKVCFANTGKEMPQTLDFVRDCADRWGVDITWLELSKMECVGHKANGNRIFDTDYKIVSYETASRSGEPFEIMIRNKGVPNPVARFCTADMKTRRINQYLREGLGWDRGYGSAIGIRYDEPSRAHKQLNGKSDSGEIKVLPLWWAKTTKYDVADFWRKQPFDLNLPNNNGVTDWGNCDLCFLKGPNKKLSIVRERPDLAQWWAAMESESGSPFRNDQPSYDRMLLIASDQTGFEFGHDVSTIPCYCGD